MRTENGRVVVDVLHSDVDRRDLAELKRFGVQRRRALQRVANVCRRLPRQRSLTRSRALTIIRSTCSKSMSALLATVTRPSRSTSKYSVALSRSTPAICKRRVRLLAARQRSPTHVAAHDESGDLRAGGRVLRQRRLIVALRKVCKPMLADFGQLDA